jgi:hypothetical protein
LCPRNLPAICPQSDESGSIATRCMSAERYSIDTNILVYSVDRREAEKHLRALDIIERSVDLGSNEGS